MATVKQMLDGKGHDVWSVRPDDTVFDAIQEMADKDVGALIVMEDGKPIGIFTERHYARNVILKGKASPGTPVRDVMAAPVICVRLDQTVEECMAVMTENRIRHLPVIDDDRLVGILSIGDLVKTIIADQKFVIEQLEHYIRS
jgi:CBS domain-containing protein